MIVTEDMVSAALNYLSDTPHPVAVARKAVTDAENKAKRIYAGAFLAASGTNDVRKYTAEVSPDYVSAKIDEANALMDLETHRAQVRSAEMLIETWRTENANARAAERVR